MPEANSFAWLVAYAPFADLVWMESAFPDFNQAKEFASGMYEVWPDSNLRMCVECPNSSKFALR
jgi:isocitrate lyase